MFYFPSLFRGNSFNAPATTDNKERNQSEEKTPPDIDYPEPLDPASLKKIAHMEDSKKLNRADCLKPVDCLSALMVKYPAFYETLCEIETKALPMPALKPLATDDY